MNVFAIGDLHLSGSPPKKPMSVFGDHWNGHWEKIRKNWISLVKNDDTVLLPGDISWGLRLNDALEDLLSVSELPGRKIMIRGNHDYWWSSSTKMSLAVNKSIAFLQGHAVRVGEIAVGGTRGYLCPSEPCFVPETDISVFNRELLRTEAALKEMSEFSADVRILMLHYPPFSSTGTGPDFMSLIERYQPDHCVFGHLHDARSFEKYNALPKRIGHTKLHLVSADYLGFSLKEIL